MNDDHEFPLLESDPPAALGRPPVEWQNLLIKYQHLLIGGLSVLGLVWIGLILQPPATPTGGAMEVDGVEGRPLSPPLRAWGGRRGFGVGDVVVVDRETLELFYSDPTGRNPTAPALIGREDRRRADAVLLLRVQPALRERMGVTDEDMERIAQTTRGLALTVPDADRSEIRAAIDAGDMDRARLLVARAANAARRDFVDRTDRAVQTLRDVLPDDRLDRMRP